MTGLLLLFVAGIWFFITIKIVIFIVGKLPKMWWRPVVGVGLFTLIFPLPLLDEIIGGQQFEQLCKENSTIQVDRQKANGRAVYLAESPSFKVKGTWVPITVQPWRFLDVNTHEIVVSYNVLLSSGGRFIRMLGISEGGMALTVRPFCEPGGVVDPLKLFKELNVTQIQRSTLNLEEQK